MRMSSDGDRHGGLGVAALVGVDEPLEQLALLGARLARPTSPRGAPAGGPASSPARAAARCWPPRRVVSSSARRLVGRPAEHVAHDQRRPLARRQHLQRREERELDRLALDGDRVRLVRAGRDLVEQPVGVRLQPRHLGERRAASRRAASCAAAGRGRRSWRCGRATPGRATALEAVAAAPGAQERLLHRVLGLVERGEHAVAVHVQLAAVALGELGEGRLVAGERRGRGGVGRAHSAPWRTSWSTQVLPSGSAKSANEP